MSREEGGTLPCDLSHGVFDVTFRLDCGSIVASMSYGYIPIVVVGQEGGLAGSLHAKARVAQTFLFYSY